MTASPPFDPASLPAPSPHRANVTRAELAALALILLAHLAYSAAFIHRSSFPLGDLRIYCLFDDAMVSMEYAKNWALGDGPVWNAGQRVEGYSNFLWMGVMALVHLARFEPQTNCLILQLIGECLLIVGLGLTWLLARTAGLSPGARVLAVAVLAAHYPTNFWALEGMETALITALTTSGLILLTRAVRTQTTSLSALLVLGITPLVRPECVLILSLSALWLFLTAPRHRTRTVGFALLAAIPLALHLLWRHSFYGDWFPNTYYLKLTGIPILERLADGLNFTWLSLWRSFPLWAAVCVGLALQPLRHLGVGLSLFAALALYQTWAGGDAWARDRFLLPLMPALIVAASFYIARLAAALSATPPMRAGILALAAFVIAAVSNLSFTRECLLIDPPLYTQDNQENVFRALAFKELSDPDATIAVSWAGAPPYFADRPGIDLLGKNDAHVARLPAQPLRRPPGHRKWDIDYSLDRLKPDVIAARYLEIFVDRDSFNYYNRHFYQFHGREVFLWVRYDTKKVFTSMMYRTSKRQN